MAERGKSTTGPGRAQKKGSGSGRVTPKGGSPKSGSRVGRYTPPEESGRITPSQAKAHKPSSKWLGVSIITLFALGVITIILDYAGALPGGVSNWWLVGSMAMIFVGLMLATVYR